MKWLSRLWQRWLDFAAESARRDAETWRKRR